MARVIHWYRTDLRLHDSPSMHQALKLKPEQLYPLFCFDPHYVYEQRVGVNRFQFLLDSLQELSDNITKINSKSQLFVVRGPPTKMLPYLFKKWKITHLVFEKDDDQYVRERDTAIRAAAKEAGVKVIDVHGHTLWESSKTIAKYSNSGKPPMSFSPFQKAVEALGAPPRPLATPSILPNPGPTPIEATRDDQPIDTKEDINAHTREAAEMIYETLSGPHGTFSVPTLAELGLKPATTSHRGGETKGLGQLAKFLSDKQQVLSFQKPNTNPGAFDPPETTVLSPHLKFGTLSIRKFYWDVKDLMDEEAKKGNKSTQPPVNLLAQIYWRDFYHCANSAIENFGQIRGNKISMYMNWKLQNQYDAEGKIKPRAEWSRDDEEAEEHFAAWSEGRTGFPWIDAIMRQLRTEGWIHHLARHSVACFLTRGHLYISWERGAEVFDEFLVDWDPSSNSGNWMWLSASAFFSSYFRVYSPIAFGKKYDKTGALIRKYCPELAEYPDKYIFQPWEAPLPVQKKAGCIIGTDYPSPIVDEKIAKAECLEQIKVAYAFKLHGDNQAVLDGTANEKLAAAEEKQEPSGSSNGKRKAPSSPSAPGKKAKVEEGQKSMLDFVKR